MASFLNSLKSKPVRNDDGIPKNILEYLTLLYHGQMSKLQEWMIENGTFYRGNKNKIDDPPNNKQCYTNSYDYCKSHPGCRLVHGWAFMMDAIPLEHAWVIDEEGDPLEVTSSRLFEYTYFGMVVPLDYYDKLRDYRAHDFIVNLARRVGEDEYELPGERNTRKRQRTEVSISGYSF